MFLHHFPIPNWRVHKVVTSGNLCSTSATILSTTTEIVWLCCRESMDSTAANRQCCKISCSTIPGSRKVILNVCLPRHVAGIPMLREA